MKRFLFIAFISLSFSSFSQSYDDLDSYYIDEVYKKIDLDYGSLDEDGRGIGYVYVKTEIDNGTYEITLEDGDGDLYEIRGTNLYITFRGYFGYAGYGEDCILEVTYLSSKVYKLE